MTSSGWIGMVAQRACFVPYGKSLLKPIGFEMRLNKKISILHGVSNRFIWWTICIKESICNQMYITEQSSNYITLDTLGSTVHSDVPFSIQLHWPLIIERIGLYSFILYNKCKVCTILELIFGLRACVWNASGLICP